ncbi:MAG: peptide chain release factor N(5)-glutamine methyltransferase [Actinomycetia bacterium]|nr:peptide chain release factor N(5)-glutamine methyltransferase [Actinomycetes bacterium]MCP4960682.1 peptide chain release factor N(5)-glutamine methyltransferase [Actinomycetes bacterium]
MQPSDEAQTDPGLDGIVEWRSLAAEALRRLSEAGVGDPHLESRWLVEEAAGFDPGDLHARQRELVTVRGITRFDTMIERRLEGVPIQYVLGHWQFRTLDLMVDHRVLIPRPETEVLAGVAIDLLADHTGPNVVDLGTGSGAIGLSVAFEHPTANVWLTDHDSEAVRVARANLAGLGRPGSRVVIVEGDWFGALPGELVGAVDAIVSNPPYIATDDQLDPSVADHEPSNALIAGDAGTEDLLSIVFGAPRWLVRGGYLMLEMDPSQVESIAAAAIERGFDSIEVVKDLAGKDRIIVAVAP